MQQTECPVCGEPAGEPCRTGSGLVMRTPHWQRVEAEARCDRMQAMTDTEYDFFLAMGEPRTERR